MYFSVRVHKDIGYCLVLYIENGMFILIYVRGDKIIVKEARGKSFVAPEIRNEMNPDSVCASSVQTSQYNYVEHRNKQRVINVTAVHVQSSVP